jgi:hypothetical protein
VISKRALRSQAMRKAKEGGVAKDAAGNVIDDVKPTYAVQAGTWGAPKEAEKARCQPPLPPPPPSY